MAERQGFGALNPAGIRVGPPHLQIPVSPSHKNQTTERQGFEPWNPLRGYMISSHARSAAPAPLHKANFIIIACEKFPRRLPAGRSTG